MMCLSVFDMFSIGIGPSSSHTVGPMRAAYKFLEMLRKSPEFQDIVSVHIDLYGSLALTGKGHATDTAVQLGLLGMLPDTVDPEQVASLLDQILQTKTIQLAQMLPVPFHPEKNIVFHKEQFLPFHPNGMQFYAHFPTRVVKQTYYSVGGGFIISHEEAKQDASFVDERNLPYPFKNAKELFDHCEQTQCSLVELIRRNERFFRTDQETDALAHTIWDAMQSSIRRGLLQEGVLPGGLGVRRRAKGLLASIQSQEGDDPASIIDWVSLWALAVNEENAAGGRVVTAPTNGSCGTVPAVIQYYLEKTKHASKEKVVDFLLVAGVMGILYKLEASISAAEMGCMGEVGVASSMAAAGLTAVLGGSNIQIENAAEIAMEHHLGLTCDPIKGLVQVPCIERNTKGALQAIAASRLALSQDHGGIVRLDHVIATMRETGKNMRSIYKETSLGGLAVNVPEC